MEKRRTVPVKLDVDSHSAALLEDTVDEFLWAANYTTRHAFKGEYVTTSKTTLHDDTYEDVRDQTALHSNHVQAARNKAAEACKSVVARWKNGKKASMPHFTSPHLVYDHRTATFHDEYVSLATVDGRIETDYVLPDKTRDTPHTDYFFSDEYETAGAELHYTNGNWMLHIHCKTDVESNTPEQATPENGTVLGVDLGVNNLAVASTGTFWTGDEFDHWRREYEKRRGDLQECGTRWAHENMQAVGRKEEGRFKQTLHRISNELVAEAHKYECSVIAFEELTDIRERTGASWGHKWAFNRLYEYVEYKTKEYGITVAQVDPENTSRRCSTCGFTHPDNRESESFECLKCGYENHADYNAAKNIGLRYLRRNQTGGDEGAPVGVRLNSGMLNANGEYESPADDSARAGVHAESQRL
ncbi:IS1341-type transposase ISNph28 [Natronomonas pharaonis DSM 2160]|uniref:IS1341-type transposase ISNph28 n=1 Tax=Natronomonas pharaonis (strain ATCC 35678 / DSM 2160 / CIP 103997 / JCM 8858 / NBRC 14720 / NCIMB 2260 / Gabara) TaxID=348780 RepID=A0A1U7EYQ4_NATPD|nr:RNA-guided endonuclease TnpB family protein [Natronomonas pharaonis]CAI50364.1 IS1341-type transposase ISNph28 [Natronomonas pharaonis DSM 2160]